MSSNTASSTILHLLWFLNAVPDRGIDVVGYTTNVSVPDTEEAAWAVESLLRLAVSNGYPVSFLSEGVRALIVETRALRPIELLYPEGLCRAIVVGDPSSDTSLRIVDSSNDMGAVDKGLKAFMACDDYPLLSPEVMIDPSMLLIVFSFARIAPDPLQKAPRFS